MKSDNKEVFNMPEGFDNSAKAIGYLNIIIGSVGLLIGCLGCFTGKCKKPVFAIPYGLLTFIVTIIFLVITILAGIVASKEGQQAMFSAACGGQISVPGKASKTVDSNLDLSKQYSKFVDQPTCSIFCPCPAITAFSNSNVNLTQAKLQDWGRYVSVSDSNANLDYT